MQRITDADIDRTCEALTDRLRLLDIIGPEEILTRTGAYCRTGVDITGGPYYGTGADHIIHGGTKRETQDALWAMLRMLELGRRTRDLR